MVQWFYCAPNLRAYWFYCAPGFRLYWFYCAPNVRVYLFILRTELYYAVVLLFIKLEGVLVYITRGNLWWSGFIALQMLGCTGFIAHGTFMVEWFYCAPNARVFWFIAHGTVCCSGFIARRTLL